MELRLLGEHMNIHVSYAIVMLGGICIAISILYLTKKWVERSKTDKQP